VTDFAGRYHQIIANERIVYVYDMHVDGEHLSTSLATVEIAPAGRGSRLVFTEQAVFFDGNDGTESRRRGTAPHFERLAALLAGEAQP
jgi:uncharacterized protein YndB with AHSA1/START domain